MSIVIAPDLDGQTPHLASHDAFGSELVSLIRPNNDCRCRAVGLDGKQCFFALTVRGVRVTVPDGAFSGTKKPFDPDEASRDRTCDVFALRVRLCFEDVDEDIFVLPVGHGMECHGSLYGRTGPGGCNVCCWLCA